VITAVDTQPIKSMDDLIAYLSDQTQVGQKVTLKVLRDGKETSVEVTLTARPENQPDQTNTSQANASSGARLGILGIALTPELDQAASLPKDQAGVLVEKVEAGSPADMAGLQGSYKSLTINGRRLLFGGDIITAIDGHAVTSVEDLQSFLQAAQPSQQVSLTILRGGKQMDIPLTLAGQ
jgi:S1-C subfamily serine protease